MIDAPNPAQPPVAPETKHYVLMMTAAVVAVMATSPADAALSALREAPGMLDPKQLDWVVKHVSTVPIELGEDPGEAGGSGT